MPLLNNSLHHSAADSIQSLDRNPIHPLPISRRTSGQVRLNRIQVTRRHSCTSLPQRCTEEMRWAGRTINPRMGARWQNGHSRLSRSMDHQFSGVENALGLDANQVHRNRARLNTAMQYLTTGVHVSQIGLFFASAANPIAMIAAFSLAPVSFLVGQVKKLCAQAFAQHLMQGGMGLSAHSPTPTTLQQRQHTKIQAVTASNLATAMKLCGLKYVRVGQRVVSRKELLLIAFNKFSADQRCANTGLPAVYQPAELKQRKTAVETELRLMVQYSINRQKEALNQLLKKHRLSHGPESDVLRFIDHHAPQYKQLHTLERRLNHLRVDRPGGVEKWSYSVTGQSVDDDMIPFHRPSANTPTESTPPTVIELLTSPQWSLFSDAGRTPSLLSHEWLSPRKSKRLDTVIQAIHDRPARACGDLADLLKLCTQSGQTMEPTTAISQHFDNPLGKDIHLKDRIEAGTLTPFTVLTTLDNTPVDLMYTAYETLSNAQKKDIHKDTPMDQTALKVDREIRRHLALNWQQHPWLTAAASPEPAARATALAQIYSTPLSTLMENMMTHFGSPERPLPLSTVDSATESTRLLAARD